MLPGVSLLASLRLRVRPVLSPIPSRQPQLYGPSGCSVAEPIPLCDYRKALPMQFGLRSLFVVIGSICVFIATLGAFGRPGIYILLGLAGWLIVVVASDR